MKVIFNIEKSEFNLDYFMDLDYKVADSANDEYYNRFDEHPIDIYVRSTANYEEIGIKVFIDVENDRNLDEQKAREIARKGVSKALDSFDYSGDVKEL